MNSHPKGDFDRLNARNTFKKNVLAVKVPITNRATRRLIEKIEQKKQNQINTQTS